MTLVPLPLLQMDQIQFSEGNMYGLGVARKSSEVTRYDMDSIDTTTTPIIKRSKDTKSELHY